MGHALCVLVERALFPAAAAARAAPPGRARGPRAPQPGARAAVIVALVGALRPKQWTKNLLLFVGVIFSQQARRPARCCARGGGLRSRSRLLSGSVYVLNDLHGRRAGPPAPEEAPAPDRLGPPRRRRGAGRLLPVLCGRGGALRRGWGRASR